MADHVAEQAAHLSEEQTALQASTTTNYGLDALKDLTFGSIAGIAGKIIEYPFDTVKVRLQSQPTGPVLLYKGPLDCFRKSIQRDGFLSLYRGVSAPIFGAAVETGSLFVSYRIAQNIFRATVCQDTAPDQPLSLGMLGLCGAVSGAFTSTLLTPIELVKCQMQVPVSSKVTAPSPFSIIRSVFRHQGLFGFWHGQMGTLIRETGGGVAWFGGKEGVSNFFQHMNTRYEQDVPIPAADKHSYSHSVNPLPLWQQLIAGAAAGMSYNFICFPADTIKSRMQTEEVGWSSRGARQNFWSTGKLLWQQQGLKGMYRGCGVTVARSAPSSAIMFTIYEGLLGWCG